MYLPLTSRPHQQALQLEEYSIDRDQVSVVADQECADVRGLCVYPALVLSVAHVALCNRCLAQTSKRHPLALLQCLG